MLKQTDVMVATVYHCYTSKLPIICSLQITIIYNEWNDAIRLQIIRANSIKPSYQTSLACELFCNSQ